jgi:hypothetical protein
VNGRHGRDDEVKIPDEEQAALEYFANEFGPPGTISRD